MDRSEFDAIRNMNGKVIVDDIRFSRRHSARPLLTAENIEVINDAGVNLRLNITFNPEVDSKTINVHVPGTGPICRLDVDGTVHRDAGRSHKHSLQTGRCSDRNLPDNVDARDDLSGRTLRGVFDEFCALANITLEGEFESPPED